MEQEIERRGPGPPKEIKQISQVVWELPTSYKKGMRVPARIYATKKLLDAMDPGVFEQVTNVATLPGIVKYAYCMPDGHWGYGFPIGGVAAFDTEKGVISPGGIGFDINCGMRFVSTNLTVKDVKPKLKELVDILFKTVPAGVGAAGFVKVNRGQFDELMVEGAKWVIDNGYGWDEDNERMEENGCIKGADPSKVSDKARSRGITQIGTLGSGNHYLEIQHAEKIFLPDVAKAFHVDKEGCIGIMIHCGSRGFGHQIGTDYLRVFEPAMKKYKIEVPDRELACAPFSSKEGQDYYHAMACAANMAFCNRQVILHRVREAFSKVFKTPAEKLGMHMVYDVAHNIAKLEKHDVDGKQVELIVHRKGSTRCMGPGRPETPSVYKKVGQPVIVGGSMETGSFLCVGTDQAARETWGSTMHGSGRTMSRTAARQQIRGDMLQKDMEKRGIIVKAVSMSGFAEEAGMAYKDINEVVETMEIAGVSKKVVQLRPLGNVKG